MRTELIFRATGDSTERGGEPRDVVTAVARLAVPDLADYCMIEVVEGDRSVRRVFAHRDPKRMAAVAGLVGRGAELREFAEGQRALAGESAMYPFSGAPAERPAMRTPVMCEIIRQLQPTSVVVVPIAVMGRTVAVASFMRTAESGVLHRPSDLALAVEVVRHTVMHHAGFRAHHFTGREDSRLRRVDEYIRSHLDSSFSLQALAGEAALSRFHLLRLFKQTYGETPFRRLTRLRMEEAQRRLLRTNDSVTEIGLACGYENPAHFAAAFRRTFGVSPTEFRRLTG